MKALRAPGVESGDGERKSGQLSVVGGQLEKQRLRVHGSIWRLNLNLLFSVCCLLLATDHRQLTTLLWPRSLY
jgi:hypothetical protein